ncbi:MAG: DUF4446 family protein [Coprococcus sp.]|nr:DUF4446 family protein [Coprococcus sp.]
MESKILAAIGIDPAYLFIILILLIIFMFLLFVNVNMKYNRLKSSYVSFMRGHDGRNMEESILRKFDELDMIARACRKNSADIKELFRMSKGNYQKVGIVKYDAFNEMGGKLSFVLTLLDGNDSGWIFNAMHSREGCYTYIKEIIRGQSYIELAEEEAESLERAIYQEVYDPEIQSAIKNSVKKKSRD